MLGMIIVSVSHENFSADQNLRIIALAPSVDINNPCFGLYTCSTSSTQNLLNFISCTSLSPLFIFTLFYSNNLNKLSKIIIFIEFFNLSNSKFKQSIVIF